MENSKAKFGVLYIVIMLSDINNQVRIWFRVSCL